MKKIYKNIIVGFLISAILPSCYNLDLNPLSQGSSESWYSTETEITMSLRSLYSTSFWSLSSESFTDDYTAREALSEVTNGTINGQTGFVVSLWSNSYDAIDNANTILSKLEKAREAGVSETFLKQAEAEAKLVRASQYARLVFHFGDVVFTETPITDLDAAYEMVRTDKETVIEAIYKDFDDAAENLDVSPGSEVRGTKGMALALKCRAALYFGDYQIAEEAAKKCIDLNAYSLHPNFSELFLPSTKTSPEFIFTIPRSVELGFTFGTRAYVSRNTGGFGQVTPSWDLFCSFLCTDGKPIDESSLYDPHYPFKNRDPRCSATIVEFNTNFLGFEYDPNPYAKEVMNYDKGIMVQNQDTRSVKQYASYNGLLLKKGVDISWTQNSYRAENSLIVIRYADVLLMYAEAKIEMNDIDQSVLDAINSVRARAYGVDKEETDKYPAVTTNNVDELRSIIRAERRMEFAFEGLRYRDLIRWKIADKALNMGVYAMLDPDDLMSKVVDKGLWFFPGIPEVDENSIVDFSNMYSTGLIKLLITKRFDSTKQYLWPIPTKEILINNNLKQNPNY